MRKTRRVFRGAMVTVLAGIAVGAYPAASGGMILEDAVRLGLVQHPKTGYEGLERWSDGTGHWSQVHPAARRAYHDAEYLALDTVAAYLPVLRQRELLALVEEYVRELSGIVGSLEKYVMVGAGSLADVYQTQARLDDARVTGTRARQALQDAEATLEIIVGGAPDNLVDPQLPTKGVPTSLEEALRLVPHDRSRGGEDEKKVVRAEVKRAWGAYETSMVRMEQLDRAIKFGALTRNAYRQQYDVAQRTLLDLLGAEREMFLFRSRYVVAMYDKRLAEFRLLAVRGLLLQTLAISPPK